MAFTETEELRIRAIETRINEIQLALNNVASRRMIKAFTNIRQQEVNDLLKRIESLEAQVLALQEDI